MRFGGHHDTVGLRHTQRATVPCRTQPPIHSASNAAKAPTRGHFGRDGVACSPRRRRGLSLTGRGEEPGFLGFARDRLLGFGWDDGKSRCAAAPSPPSLRSAASPVKITGAVGSGFLRCAQDDTKKVLTGRSPHLLSV